MALTKRGHTEATVSHLPVQILKILFNFSIIARPVKKKFFFFSLRFYMGRLL